MSPQGFLSAYTVDGRAAIHPIGFAEVFGIYPQ